MLDFRFDGQDLTLWIDKNTTKDELITEIDGKIDKMITFFEEGTQLSVYFEAGMEQSDFIPFILDKISERKITLKSLLFVKPERKLNRQMNITDLSEKKESTEEKAPVTNRLKIFRMTIRSGQIFEYEGDALLIGNVNKGAEVTIYGNLIVLGEVKGNLRVGKNDPEDSFILATSLHPNIIQIGDTISSDISSDEIAICKLKNGRLTLEPITDHLISGELLRR